MPLDVRIDMARQALPYLHAKPQPAPAPQLRDGESRQRVKLRRKTADPNEDLELDDEWLGIDGAADPPSDLQALATIAADEAASLQGKEDVAAAENTRAREADALAKVSPMTFLRAVMLHPRTPLHQRLKVAAILAPYLHAKPTAAPPSEPSFEVDDQYGFAVDPALARRLRDLVRPPQLASAGAHNGHGEAIAKERDAKLAEEKKTLRCAPTYGGADAKRDRQRLDELAHIRKARVLTAEEDAEEIHLTARALSYENSTEYAEREALRRERDRDREALHATCNELYKKWQDYSISEIEQQEFDRLRAFLNKIDADRILNRDPVYSDFSHQLCIEAWLRGQPEPSAEETKKRLAEMPSSAEINRRPRRKPEDARSPWDVDLAAWLRGEVTYAPWIMRKALPPKYRGDALDELLMIALVRDEKLVSDLEVPAYSAWILWIYDEELRRGNNPAENFKAARAKATEKTMESSRATIRSTHEGFVNALRA